MSYRTQIDAAKQGVITKQMEIVAQKEHLEPEVIRQRVAQGTVVIPALGSTPFGGRIPIRYSHNFFTTIRRKK